MCLPPAVCLAEESRCRDANVQRENRGREGDREKERKGRHRGQRDLLPGA